MSDSNSGGKFWVAVGAIGALLGGAAAMLVALRAQAPAPVTSTTAVTAPALEATVPTTNGPNPPQALPPTAPKMVERPMPRERWPEPVAPLVNEIVATPFSGHWRGYYVCADSFGDGRNSLEFTVEDGQPVRALEQFQRGFLSGTVVYRIVNHSSDGAAITLSTDNFGGYQIQLTYNATADALEGVYLEHASCKNMRLTR